MMLRQLIHGSRQLLQQSLRSQCNLCPLMLSRYFHPASITLTERSHVDEANDNRDNDALLYDDGIEDIENSIDSDDPFDDLEDMEQPILPFEELQRFVEPPSRHYDNGSSSTECFVIHTRLKWIPTAAAVAELQCDEAVGLAEAVGWNIAGRCVVHLGRPHSKTYLWPDRIEQLAGWLASVPQRKPNRVIMLNVNNTRLGISPRNRQVLQRYLGVPIFDRFSVILQIFADRAQSQEAKLQVKLARIDYERSVLFGTEADSGDVAVASSGGHGEHIVAEQRSFKLGAEAAKLRRQIDLLGARHQVKRSNLQTRHIPVVGVVGYTNAGKTHLVRTLSSSNDLEPEDMLFATLDTTGHYGRLPSGARCLFVDTVGFISNLPHLLISAFQHTLQDALNADLLIHVRDIHHPETRNQRKQVLNVLSSIPIASDNSNVPIIEVLNKSDLMSPEWTPDDEIRDDPDALAISCKTNDGIDELIKRIEKTLFSDSLLSHATVTFNVEDTDKNTSRLAWLHKNAGAVKVKTDRTGCFLVVEIISHPNVLEVYRGKFGSHGITTAAHPFGIPPEPEEVPFVSKFAKQEVKKGRRNISL